MPPLEEYLEHADELAQNVVDAWALNTEAGNSSFLTEQSKELFDKAYRYRLAKRLVDNHREHNMLSDADVAEEKAARQAFAEGYKALHEKHAEAS